MHSDGSSGTTKLPRNRSRSASATCAIRWPIRITHMPSVGDECAPLSRRSESKSIFCRSATDIKLVPQVGNHELNDLDQPEDARSQNAGDDDERAEQQHGTHPVDHADVLS